MMFYRHTLPYWSRGNYKQVLKNWKIAINSPTYVISNYNFMANLMMVGPTSYPKMIWSFLKYITKIMNYDFLSPGDREEAKKYCVSKKKCQRSFVNWKKMRQKTTSSPFLTQMTLI